MDGTVVILILILWVVGVYFFGRQRAVAAGGVGGHAALHSRPGYYGSYVAIWAGIPVLVLFGLWLVLERTIIEHLVIAGSDYLSGLREGDLKLQMTGIRGTIEGSAFAGKPNPKTASAVAHYRDLLQLSLYIRIALLLIVGTIGLWLGLRQINPSMRARNRVEAVLLGALMVCSVLAILTTVGIVVSLMWEGVRFFLDVPVWEFLFGTHWSTQTAQRADQVAADGSFGAVPVFLGTLLITVIAMVLAVPVGLFSAIYLSEYASPRTRGTVKPLMEILAGIPTVVYGVFAALTVAPFFKDVGDLVGLEISARSALAAGVVMGIMIIPFVSSLSDDVINAVPQSLRDGAYALGATKSETVRQVLLPAALPGIVGAVLLAVSRAIGETMIVVMAAGTAAKLTANPLDSVTTVTVQIVTLLTGDQDFNTTKTLAVFALGLTLFFVTLALNVVALKVVQRYREKYD